jgi:hypothetical protein
MPSAPLRETEMQMAQLDQLPVVCEILGEALGRSALDPSDDFFVVGGNSSLAVDALATLRTRTGVSVPFVDFYSDPTPAGIAAALARIEVGNSWLPRPVKVDRSGNLPLTLRQETRLRRYGLELPPWRSAVQAAFVIDADIDVAALSSAANLVIDRHEALRTFVSLGDDGPCQRLFATYGPADVQVTDLREEAVPQYLSEFARQPFNLETGPLLRVGLGRLAPGRSLLIVSMDHFVSDGRALEVVISELSATMTGKELGQPPEFHYSDFAAWQRKLLSGDARRELERYWHGVLGGSVPQLALPRSAGASGGHHDGAIVERTVSQGAMSAVSEFAQQHNVPLFAALAGAWALILTREAGSGPVSMLSPCTSRVQPGFEVMIGDLSNSVPLIFDLPPDATFRQVAEISNGVCNGLVNYGMFPYDEIMKLAAAGSPLPAELPEVFFSVGELSKVSLDGAAARSVLTPATRSFFELSHFLISDDDGVVSRAMFKPSLFTRDHIVRLLELFEMLLKFGSSSPDAPALSGLT